jgi:hypothetical protein
LTTSGYTHLAWLQVSWPVYNAINGETFCAAGDQDGDGKSEIVLGLGGGISQGWMEILGNSSTGYAHQSWLQLDWPADANGETRPEIKEVDGDGREEIVVGHGAGGGGWLKIFDNTADSFQHRLWMQVPWNAYNIVNGSINPDH